MDLNALADFCLVAAHGGFGKASRVSGKSKATLSRKVAELEEELGMRLVERGPKGLALTEAGRLLLAGAEGPIHEVADAVSAAREGAARPRGRLRIAAPLLFAQMALGALCAQFRRAYPDVQVDVMAEDRVSDLIDERFDLAIRPNPGDATQLVGRCFAKDRLMLVAPKGSALPAQGATVAAVGMSARLSETWTLDGGKLELRPDYVLGFSSLLMVRDAVLAGAGAAALPYSLVWRHLDEGRLSGWGVLDGGAVELWVLHTSRRLALPKVRAFVDFLGAQYPEGVLTFDS